MREFIGSRHTLNNILKCILWVGSPGGASGEEPSRQCRRQARDTLDPWEGIFWRRVWQPTPVLLPGESHGQRSLAGYSPQGCEGSGMTEYTGLQEEGRDIRVRESRRCWLRGWRKGLEGKAASRSWKGKDHPQEEWGPHDFSLMEAILDSWSIEL